jgi:transcriptional regulator GlxA family with amidase domain
MTKLTVGLLLFPAFDVLDMAGPIEVLNVLSVHLSKPLHLHVIASTTDPVSPGPLEPGPATSFAGQQLYLPTHTLATAPPLDLLIVPGGPGTLSKETLQPHLAFIRDVHRGTPDHPPAKFLFSVCSGSMLFAWAGVLDGQRATTNKAFWEAITPNGPKTHWVAKARWVVSGNVWTTSGVTAGIDGMLALVARIWGEETAEEVGATIEHTRARGKDDDPWAERYGCRDVMPVGGG